MKYPYRVKHNGVWYDANTEIPDGKASNEPEKAVEVDEPKVVAEEPTEPENEPENEVDEGATSSAYTKADIESMGRSDLFKVAKEVGIKNFTTMKGDVLKAEIIAKFGL